MNELGEGDIDIIKQPIVIDNVSLPFNCLTVAGVWPNEGRYWRRVRANSGVQLLVSSFGPLICFKVWDDQFIRRL